MKKRTITGIIFLLILIPTFFIERFTYLFEVTLYFLITVSTYEIIKVIFKEKYLDKFFIALIINYLSIYSIMRLSVDNYQGIFKDISFNSHYLLPIILIFILIFLIDYVLDKNIKFSDIGNILFTNFYLIAGYSSFYFLRLVDYKLLILLFIVTMSTDVFAYLFGVKFGKHKITKISPKKSWEGSIAGSLFATLFGVLFIKLADVNVLSKENIFLLIIFILLLSIISQIGDLVASKIKREKEVKDFGYILPGHGGILDRFDSALLASIFLMFLTYLYI